MVQETSGESVREAGEQAPTSVPGRIWGGTALLVLGRLWGSACTFATLWLLAQRLPAEGFGRYTFYLALIALDDSLTDLGTSHVAVQRTAGDPLAIPSVLASARAIRVRAGLLGVLLIGGWALATGEPGAGWLLLASLYPVTHALELSATVYKNRIAWSVPVLIRAAASTLSLVFVLLLLARDVEEPAIYLCGVAAGSTLANVALHLASRRHLPRALAMDRVPARGIFAAALPLGLAGLCQQAYFYVDNLFVRGILGPVPLGHYNVGVRILSYTIMVAVYASLAALPWLTRRQAAGDLGPSLARLAQPLFALAGFGCGLLCPWAEELLRLFGPEFADAGPSLRWLFGATCVIYAGSALMTGVIAAGRGKSLLAIAASGLLVNLAGNTVLVPLHGIEGAAEATLLTELAVALGATVALARAGVRPFAGARALLWLGGPAAFAAGWWLSSHLPIG